MFCIVKRLFIMDRRGMKMKIQKTIIPWKLDTKFLIQMMEYHNNMYKILNPDGEESSDCKMSNFHSKCVLFLARVATEADEMMD